MSGKVAMGVVRDSRKFSGHPYMPHRAVIFAIAQLSCYVCLVLWALLPEINFMDVRMDGWMDGSYRYITRPIVLRST